MWRFRKIILCVFKYVHVDNMKQLIIQDIHIDRIMAFLKGKNVFFFFIQIDSVIFKIVYCFIFASAYNKLNIFYLFKQYHWTDDLNAIL